MSSVLQIQGNGKSTYSLNGSLIDNAVIRMVVLFQHFLPRALWQIEHKIRGFNQNERLQQNTSNLRTYQRDRKFR